MLRTTALQRVAWTGGLAAALLANALLAVALARDEMLPLAIAFVPAALVALGALIASDRAVLALGALVLGMAPGFLKDPIPIGSLEVHAADLIVALALGSWLTARVIAGPRRSTLPWSGTPVLGWPFALFAAAVLLAAIRGHFAHGASLVGQPLRLVLYTLIAFAIVGTDARRLYRGITVAFYAGTVWVLLNAFFHITSGTSQTESADLSTGGTRVLALTVALYLVPALVLALLNLELDTSARRRALHLAVAACASVGILVGFGRGVYAAVAVIVPVLFVTSRHVRAALVGVLPLLVPFLVLAVLIVPRAFPDLVTTFSDRTTSPTAGDRAVVWRQEANKAVWEQVQESPLIGVGFGRQASFMIEDRQQTVNQDPHNSWVYLLAGGGAITFGSFLLLLGAFVVDSWRRYKGAVARHEQLLILWSGLTLFAFLLNAIVEPLLSWPSLVLTVWTLLLLPSAVPRRTAPAR